MTITFYINNSEDRVVEKNINYIATLNGYLRSGASIINPVLEIESDELLNYIYSVSDADGDDIIDADDADIVISDDISIFNVNYIYILEYGRYYYVTDLVTDTNRLFIFSLHVDVLMSFKASFLPLSALISRNQYLYDTYIEDEKMPYEFIQRVNTYKINTGNDFTFNTTVESSDVTYAITYMEENGVYETTSYISSPTTVLPDVSIIATGRNRFSKTRFIKSSLVDSIANRGITNESEMSYIASLVAYPFEIPHYAISAEELKIGTYTYTGSETFIQSGYTNTMSPYFRVASFNVGDYVTATYPYLLKEPYTIYELYLAYYGWTELKSSDILNSTINIYYTFDWVQGTALINIVNATKGYVIKSLNATVGVKIAVNRTNQQQLNDEKTQLAIKSTISAIGSVASIGVGAVTKNPFLIASGITGLTSTGVDIGSKLSMMHEKAYTSNNSGYEGVYSVQDTILKVTRYSTKEPNQYAKYYGRPLNQTVALNTLSGYTLIHDIHLDGIDATKTEIDELYSILTDGIML